MPHPRSVESEIWPEFLNRCVHKLPRWFWCSLEFEHHFSSRFPSVQLSRSVVSNSLRPHGPQHTRPPCPSLTPGIDSDSCPLIAIQPSHPLLSPSPLAFNLSQHQGLFRWVSSSHQVAKVLEFQLQHQSFVHIQDWSALGWTGWISLQSKGLSGVFSNTAVQEHQFFGAQLSFLPQTSISHFSLSHSSSSSLFSSLSVH